MTHVSPKVQRADPVRLCDRDAGAVVIEELQDGIEGGSGRRDVRPNLGRHGSRGRSRRERACRRRASLWGLAGRLRTCGLCEQAVLCAVPVRYICGGSGGRVSPSRKGLLGEALSAGPSRTARSSPISACRGTLRHSTMRSVRPGAVPAHSRRSRYVCGSGNGCRPQTAQRATARRPRST